MKGFDPAVGLPLEGLKVLDLSRFICGNMLTMLLGDFGADVIKVENPKHGDTLRDLQVNGLSVFWKVYGRNKRSLSLDLHAQEGRAVLLDLIEKADLLVESFRSGTLEKMGLAPHVLLARNPRLLIVRISGFGQTGAYSNRPGFGTLVEAMSGFAAKNGFPDRTPVLPNMPLADMVAGVYGAFATLVAVQSREHTHCGQVIDLSLLEPLVSILGPDPAIFALTGKEPSRTGSRSDSVAPRNIYRTGDGGHVAISASVQSMAKRLFDVIGRPDLIDDPRFCTNTERLNNVDEMDQIIEGWTLRRSREACLATLQTADVTAGPVYTVGDLTRDVHARTRELFVEAPDSEAGKILMHNIIPRLSATPGAIRQPAPALGDDSEAVLGEIGYDVATIAKLVDKGVVTIRNPDKSEHDPAPTSRSQ
jgi:crotonobetainyl-CoA:carnitine CoA-transferase CaiB-like acyl-CoA transferase